ncbi:PASTA domain-containing protein [Kribbella jiaozuonensis]|uniref:PASTA domain-containing protein n=1 Tax=Kribbella jiaozuonensis TaxID=2575441 RepID=A0A4U3LJL0_9ACTN|nr:PASTA domain-containing protein [Kribbella jiaozuonensis]TKK74317.1 PASTA domain-containing protein [Kribbella jiaozuonensis]
MEPRPDATRGRGVLASAAAAITVLAVIGVTNALSSNGGGTLIITPDPPPGPVAMRMVGYGHAAIAVPKVWGTNASRCGIPHRDTVLIDDPAAASYCDLPRPPDVDSVELGTDPPSGFQVDEVFLVNGVRAERRKTTCASDDVCWGAVGLPSLHVWFRASSSTDASVVDEILSRIEILPDRVGVPSSRTTDGRDSTAYAKSLRELGLRTEISTRTSTVYKPGRLVSVSPSPGTLLSPGETVTLTVIK